jgi:hypothetical protein
MHTMWQQVLSVFASVTNNKNSSTLMQSPKIFCWYGVKLISLLPIWNIIFLFSVARTEISLAPEWILTFQEELFFIELGSCYIGFNKSMYAFRNVLYFGCCRALELAIKHKTHVDTVLFFRKKYLETFDKPETSLKFLQFKNEVRIFFL